MVTNIKIQNNKFIQILNNLLKKKTKKKRLLMLYAVKLLLYIIHCVIVLNIVINIK
jgi:hypothetical protein